VEIILDYAGIENNLPSLLFMVRVRWRCLY